jgi:hypothetical protein
MNEQNEEYVKALYTALGGDEKGWNFDDFSDMISSDEDYNRTVFSSINSEGSYNYDDFSLMTGLKKKDQSSASPSDSSSQNPFLAFIPTYNAEAEAEGGTSLDFLNVNIEESLRNTSETPFFRGVIPEHIESFKNANPVSGGFLGEIWDTVDDLARSVYVGQGRSASIESTMDLMGLGADKVTPEAVNTYVSSLGDSWSRQNEYGQSKEVQDWYLHYKDNGEDWLAALEATMLNPSAAASIFIESMGAFLNEYSAKQAAAAVGGGALLGGTRGALIGSEAGGVGAGAGALAGGAAGAVKSVPYAMALMGGTIDANASFAEFLQEELGELEFNAENVYKVLTNPEANKRIRMRTLQRSGTVAVVDALIGRTIFNASTRLRNAGVSNLKVAGTGVGIGVGGGWLQESVARLAAGQSMDTAEIYWEGVAGIVPGSINIAAASMMPNSYSINNQKVDRQTMSDYLDVVSLGQLLEQEVKIENDRELIAIKNKKERQARIWGSIDENIPSDIKQKLYELELRRAELLEKTTRSAKTELASIEQEIDQTIENYRSTLQGPAMLNPRFPSEIAIPLAEPVLGQNGEMITQRIIKRTELQEPNPSKLGKLFRRRGRDITLRGRVYDSSSRWRKVRRLWNDTFKSNAGLDKKTAEIYRQMGRDRSAYTLRIQNDLARVNAVVSGARKAVNNDVAMADARTIAINSYLNGEDVDVSFLSQEDLASLDYARTQLDTMSARIIDSLIAHNPDWQKNPKLKMLIDTIQNNMGSYMKRSYQIFSDPTWAEAFSVPYEEMTEKTRELYDGAVQFVLQNSENAQTVEDARAIVTEYINKIRRMDQFEFATGSPGSAFAPFLKGRKDIPVEFRRLMGESNDPIFNYANTMDRLNGYLSNIQYQGTLANHLLNSGLAKTRLEPGYVAMAPNTENWNSLSELYVPEELKQQIESLAPLGRIDNSALRTFVQLTGSVKLGKTVLSPTTTSRNFISGMFLMLNSGHFFGMSDPKTMIQTVTNAKRAAWAGNPEVEAERLARLGILGDGAISGEMMAILRDFDSNIDEIINSTDPTMSEKAMQWAARVYAFGDDFYKTIGFYEEFNTLREYGMSESEAEAMAAERIRNSYPTYSYLPRNIKALRRFPITGTFVSFPWEVWRTSRNNLKYIAEDLDAGRTKMAYRRIAGMLVANGSLFALSEASKNMLGLDDEDDERIRTLTPDYQENSEFIYIGSDDESAQFIDGTALFPAEVIFKPIRALIENPSDREGLNRVLRTFDEAMSPYVGLDLTVKTTSEILSNEDEYGRPIYDEGKIESGYPIINGVINDPVKIMDYLASKAGPGVYNNMKEFMRALGVAPDVFGDKYSTYREYTPEDAILGVLGFRTTTVDYSKAIRSKVSSDKINLTEQETKTFSDISYQREMTEDEVRSVVTNYINERNAYYQNVIGYVDTGRALGLTDDALYDQLVGGGVSKSDMDWIMDNMIPPLKGISVQRTENREEQIRLDMSRSAERENIDTMIGIYRANIDLFDKILLEYTNE